MKTLVGFIDKYGYDLTVGELLHYSQGFSGPPNDITTACMESFQKYRNSEYVKRWKYTDMHLYSNAILYLESKGLLNLDKLKKL